MTNRKTRVIASLLVLTGVLPTNSAEMLKVELQHPPCVDRYGDPLPPGAIARLGTIRWRHGDQVRAVAFSPDGRTLASGSGDKAVHLWDVKTGRRLRTFRGHEAEVSCVRFTPDGTRLVTLGLDKTTRLWSVATGKELRRWNTPGGWKVALSPDGKTLAALGAMQPKPALYLWDVATGEKFGEMPYEGQTVWFMVLAFSPDGKTLVCGGGRELRYWDVASGKQLEVVGAGRGEIFSIAFAPDGKTFAVGSQDATTIWDSATRKKNRRLPESPVYGVAISPDGKRLATGSSTVRIWDIDTGKELCVCKGRHRGRVWDVVFSPDGKTVVGGNDGHSIQLWDAVTGEERTPADGHQSGLRFTRFTPNGKEILTGSNDGWVRRWDLAKAKETLRFLPNEDSFFRPFALTLDGRTLAVENNKAIELWNTANARMLRRFAEHKSGITHLAFSPRGDRIASRAFVGMDVLLWDLKSGKRLNAIDAAMTCLSFSPDGKILATSGGDDDEVVCLWNADTGKLIRRWPAHGPSIDGLVRGCNVVFSADGKLLASAGADQTIRIWETATGRALGRLQPDRPYSCSSLAFAPDGKSLATGGSDQTVRLWETASGRERRCFGGHSGWVSSVDYSADGRLLVSGGDDTSALVWPVWPSISAEEDTVLTLSERRHLWLDLAKADASRAWWAMAQLHNHPRSALALLKEKLPPAARPEEKRLVQLIADLDSDRFDIRSKAETELANLGELAEPALRRTWRRKPASLEQRLRLEALLQRLDGSNTSTQTLRQLRAVEVLERIASPQAQEVLQTLATGTSEARLTREAKAALERIAHKSSTAP